MERLAETELERRERFRVPLVRVRKCLPEAAARRKIDAIRPSQDKVKEVDVTKTPDGNHMKSVQRLDGDKKTTKFTTTTEDAAEKHKNSAMKKQVRFAVPPDRRPDDGHRQSKETAKPVRRSARIKKQSQIKL